MPEESNCFLDFMLQSQAHKKLQYAKVADLQNQESLFNNKRKKTLKKMASDGEVCPIPAEPKEVDIYRDTPLR